MTDAEREQRRRERAAAMEEGELQAEVDRQHEIERKRLRLNPEENPGADRRLRERVERSVRVQWRKGEVAALNPKARTRLELEETIERATDDALRREGLDVENPTPQQLVEIGVLKSRIRELYARQGKELPSGPGKYAPTSVSYKIQSAAPVSTGAARSRIPVARMETSVRPTRSMTEEEENKWLERVERSDEGYTLDPSKPRRVNVVSRLWNDEQDYRLRIQREATAELQDRMTRLSMERGALVPIETHIVNEDGRPLLKIRPSMEFMQNIASRISEENT